MTRDDIIRMAENAGMPFNKSGLIGCERCEFDADEILERFAALVAAHDREEADSTLASLVDCVASALRNVNLSDDRIKLGDDLRPYIWSLSYKAVEERISKDSAVAEAVAAEREACAKVCDDLVADVMVGNPEWNIGVLNCVAAIRARGDKP